MLSEAPHHPLLGRPSRSATAGFSISLEAQPYIAQHALRDESGAGERIVVPASLYLEVFCAAAARTFGEPFVLEDVSYEGALALVPGESHQLRLDVASFADGRIQCILYAYATRRVASCTALADVEAPPASTVFASPARPPTLDADGFEADLRAKGYCWRPFIDRLWIEAGEVIAEVVCDRGFAAEGHLLHPALMGACSDAALALLPHPPVTPADARGAIHLTVSQRSVRVRAPLPDRFLVRATPQRSPDSATLVADLTAVSQDGQVLLEVKGYTLRRQSEARAPDGFFSVEWVEWTPAPGPAPAGTWLFFEDEGGVARALRAAYDKAGCATIGVRRGAADVAVTAGRLFDEAIRAPGIRGIVYAWALDADSDPEALSRGLELGVRGVFALVQAAERAQLLELDRFVVVTRPNVALAPLRGLARVIEAEYPKLSVQHVELGPSDELAPIVAALSATDFEPEVLVRGGRLLVPRLSRIPLADLAAAPAAQAPRRDRAYLVTGAFGGIGWEIVRWLVAGGAGAVYLMGRRPPSEAQARQIEAWSSVTKVRVALGDVARREAVSGVVATIEREGEILGGVFHVAGATEDGMLAGLGREAFEVPLAAKVWGTLWLHQATARAPLDQFVMFSSVTSLLGLVGLGSYAAANAFLDAFAELRRGEGRPATTIQWGPWEIGAFASLAPAERQAWGHGAFHTLRAGDAMAALDLAMRSGRAQVGVFPFDVDRLAAGCAGRVPHLFRNLTPRAPSEPRPAAPSLDALSKMMPNGRLEHLQELVMRCLREALDLAPERALSLSRVRPFRDLGVSSKRAVRLASALQSELGLPIAPGIVFAYPTVASLAKHLLDKRITPLLGESDVAGEEAAQPNLSDEEHDRKLAADLSGMRADEIADLLSKELDDL